MFNSSSLPSSYQFDCFVASFEGASGSGADADSAPKSSVRALGADAEDAVTVAFFRLLFILLLSSSSEEEKSESELVAGGGVGAFFRKLVFDFAERFLKNTWGGSSAACVPSIASSRLIVRSIRDVVIVESSLSVTVEVDIDRSFTISKNATQLLSI